MPETFFPGEPVRESDAAFAARMAARQRLQLGPPDPAPVTGTVQLVQLGLVTIQTPGGGVRTVPVGDCQRVVESGRAPEG